MQYSIHTECGRGQELVYGKYSDDFMFGMSRIRNRSRNGENKGELVYHIMVQKSTCIAKQVLLALFFFSFFDLFCVDRYNTPYKTLPNANHYESVTLAVQRKNSIVCLDSGFSWSAWKVESISRRLARPGTVVEQGTYPSILVA